MQASSEISAPRLVPMMRYRDLAAAVDWLCDAFGFEKQVVVSAGDGNVHYAQLTYSNGLVMLGAINETDLDKLMRQPDEVGGIETQSCYIVVDDIGAHYERAAAAGAEIVLEIKSDSFGRKGYSCRDPQGHIWNFGTYDPWKGRVPASAAVEPAGGWRRRMSNWQTAMGVAGLAVVALGAGWLFGFNLFHTGKLADAGSRNRDPIETLDNVEKRLLKTAGDTPTEARSDLASERSAREGVERTLAAARAELQREREAREAAERGQQKLQLDLVQLRSQLEDAIRNMEAARLELAKERGLKPPRPNQKSTSAQPPSGPTPQAKNDAPAKAAKAEGREAAIIETAATPTTEPDKATEIAGKFAGTSATADDPSDAASGPKPQSRAYRQRRALASQAYKSTYIIELHDVPWPYNVWRQ